MINKVVEIAILAGDEIMKIYESTAGLGYDKKDDDSPLTQADLAANEIIVRELAKHFPSIHMISEEEKLTSFEDRKTWERSWIVDPLDGTKEFIKRNGEFTVNIALVEKGLPILGVVYAPALDILAWAEKGSGAFYKKGKEEAKRLSPNDPVIDPIRIVCSRSHMSAEVEAFVNQIPNHDTKSSGSSLKFLLLAMGEADVYPRLAPTMEWDTAAGHCVLMEAGGEVLRADTMTPLLYNKEVLRNPYIIAYRPGVKEKLDGLSVVV